MLRIITYLLLALSAATNSSLASNIQTITVTKGRVEAMPIAINHFAADDKELSQVAEKINEVITNDLKKSGIFKAISPAAFIEKKLGIKHEPLFVSWRQINSNLLVNGEVKKISSNKYKISFILWDTLLQKDLVGEEIHIPINMWRRGAHKIADKIYEKITGDRGYFDTRIVYVSESGPPLNRVRRIALMDQDGANNQFLTDGKSLVMTPKFSPLADKILYVSYIKKIPKIILKNLKTGKDIIIGDFPGISFAPRYSPDGNKALVSVAKFGATHIYEVNFKTLTKTKLTSGAGINTSPSYSPDGKKIVFNSDRNGTRQLYVMNSDGSGVERISFGGGAYACPAWSPRGDYIAFTKITRGEGFTIGVLRPDGNGERIITSGYLLEGPVWAPNGRVVMFTKGRAPRGKDGFRHLLYFIDVTGYNERLVTTPQDASYGDWSRNID